MNSVMNHGERIKLKQSTGFRKRVHRDPGLCGKSVCVATACWALAVGLY